MLDDFHKIDLSCARLEAGGRLRTCRGLVCPEFTLVFAHWFDRMTDAIEAEAAAR
jgi:hypothetical protein